MTTNEFDIIDKQDEPDISNKIEIYDPHKKLSDFYKYNKNCFWLGVSMIFVDLLVLIPLFSIFTNIILRFLSFLVKDKEILGGDIAIFIDLYIAIIAVRIILLITSIVLKIKKIISKKCFLILLVFWSIPLISALLFFGWCFYEFRNF